MPRTTISLKYPRPRDSTFANNHPPPMPPPLCFMQRRMKNSRPDRINRPPRAAFRASSGRLLAGALLTRLNHRAALSPGLDAAPFGPLDRGWTLVGIRGIQRRPLNAHGIVKVHRSPQRRGGRGEQEAWGYVSDIMPPSSLPPRPLAPPFSHPARDPKRNSIPSSRSGRLAPLTNNATLCRPRPHWFRTSYSALISAGAFRGH
ncbi:hypothetical protein KM043_002472 [Ampulex compressa]|nr:hypothetical protein KM043_002472 [Ampulex compressa]